MFWLRFLLVFSIYLFQFLPVHSLPFTGYYWEESGSIFLIPSYKVFIHMDGIPPDLLFSRLNHFSCQSFLIQETLQSLTHFWGPSLGLLPYVHVFHICGSPEFDTALHMCSPHHWIKGKDHFLQLATLFLMQPRKLLATFAAKAHCWFMFNCMSISTPGSISKNLLSYQMALSMYQCLGIFFHTCKISHFHFLKLIRYLFADFFSPSNSLWMAAQSWWNNHSFQFWIACEFAEGK